MRTKRINGYLRVDWKKGKISARKTEPKASGLGANELLVPVKIDVEIPEPDMPTLGVTVEAPAAKVAAGNLESIPADEQPGWTDIADEKISYLTDDLEEADDPYEIQKVVESVVANTLIDAAGRPKAENVEEYTHNRVMAIYDENEG